MSALPASISANPVKNDWRYWTCRLVSGGPRVACQMWRVEHRDDLGRLIADVEYHAEIDGEPTDPFAPRGWPWHPITFDDWSYMTALANHARQHSPLDPAANPTRRIDHNEIPSLF